MKEKKVLLAKKGATYKPNYVAIAIAVMFYLTLALLSLSLLLWLLRGFQKWFKPARTPVMAQQVVVQGQHVAPMNPDTVFRQQGGTPLTQM